MSNRIIATQHAIDAHRDAMQEFDLDTEQQVIDLITSLRLYCDACDLDFTGIVRSSKIQHQHLQE